MDRRHTKAPRPADRPAASLHPGPLPGFAASDAAAGCLSRPSDPAVSRAVRAGARGAGESGPEGGVRWRSPPRLSRSSAPCWVPVSSVSSSTTRPAPSVSRRCGTGP
ncbi:hypothetical protein E2C11_28145 [Streptomyces lavendulae]|nr:hypothetical protein E2C11_28145 [Streptomyces lavendulae]